MAEIGQYITVLVESLQKKKSVLEAILQKNEEQFNTIREKQGLDNFDRLVEEKSRLIEAMEKLDKGFENIYQRIRSELEGQKNRFGGEIGELQSLIVEITDLGVRIEASEARNKQAVERYFADARNEIQQSRKSVKAASDYYRSMSRVNYVDPQMMDRKK